jgi:hypothetical protein
MSLQLASSLTFSKDGSGNLPLESFSNTIETVGKNFTKYTKLITTSDDTFNLGDIGTIGHVRIRNLGASLVRTPGTPLVTNVGTSGATTWTYKVVANQSDGGHTVASAAGTTTTGNATLDETNYNKIKWIPIPNASTYDIYRTAAGGTPSTTGLVDTVSAASVFVDTNGVTYAFYDDQGGAGDTTSAPSTTIFDYQVKIGSDGTLYPILTRGGEIFPPTRWNAAAIHAKALFNSTLVEITIIED